MRIEVQVSEARPRRPVASRTDMPRETLSRVAGKLSDSPLKETLERIATSPPRATRAKR